MIATVVSNEDFQFLRHLKESTNWYKAQKDEKFAKALEKEQNIYKKALRGTTSSALLKKNKKAA